MIRIFVMITFVVSSLTLNAREVQAHTIGGAYASLISCKWGQYGNQYGYIGAYKVNGQIISQFFGSAYCAY